MGKVRQNTKGEKGLTEKGKWERMPRKRYKQELAVSPLLLFVNKAGQQKQ